MEPPEGATTLRPSLIHPGSQRTTLTRSAIFDTADIRTTAEVVRQDTPQLLSRIAQRLREPAEALLDLTRRSLESDLPDAALKAFGLIEDRTNTLLTLANDLNDLSMLEAGHLQLNTETFSLRRLVSHVSQTIDSTESELGREIEVDISADVPDAVIGDPGRLRLVIVRFIETVTTRSSTDRVALKVGVEHRSQGAVTLRFEIEAVEDGSTLGGAHVTRPEPIASGDTSAMLLDHGMLGMTVALATVSRMGGRVTVDSEQRHSVAVQFTIRLEISEDGSGHCLTVDDQTPIEGLILVIADVADARRPIAKMLSEAELPYLVVSSVEAWTAATQAADDESVPPALTVIDSSVDSFAVCDRFREVAPSVPVVVVVPSGTRGDAARCREHGVKGFLANPTRPDDLFSVVEQQRSAELIRAE